MLLHDASHTFEHNFTRIFEELARFDVLRVYHGTAMRLSNAVLISRHLSPALYPAPTCTKRPRTASLKFLSRAIRAINDCFTPIDNREHSALFFQRFNKIAATLLPRKMLFLRIQSGGLPRQITLRLLHIMEPLSRYHVFSFTKTRFFYHLILRCNFCCTHTLSECNRG